MQYLSSFVPMTKPSIPTTVFLSDDDNLPQISEDTIEEIFRKARTTLGGGFQLNPVRGQTAEKYYFTQMRNANYSRDAVSAADNTVLAAALRTSTEIASLASDGTSESYTVFDYAVSQAIYTYPLKRNCVINPGIGHTQVSMPTFTISVGSGANWTGYYLDSYVGPYGSAPAKVNAYADVSNRGNYTITPTYTVTDNTPLVDCMYATRYQSSSSYNPQISFVNNKVTEGFYSTEKLFDEETVDLHYGLLPFSTSLFWKFERDTDFTVDSNLLPGSRPFISFPTTHTEL